MKGMDNDSSPEKLNQSDYKFLPNERMPKKIDMLTLDFKGLNSNDFTYVSLDKDNVTIEQNDNNTITLKREMAMMIANFILKGYDNPNIPLTKDE